MSLPPVLGVALPASDYREGSCHLESCLVLPMGEEVGGRRPPAANPKPRVCAFRASQVGRAGECVGRAAAAALDWWDCQWPAPERR